MIRLLWGLSAHTRYFLRRYMPTSIALDAIRIRRGLKRGIPAMPLAAPYLLAANYCMTVIDGGGPGWLNLLVLLFCWNALKFLIMGPVSLVLLIRVHIQEAIARHRGSHQNNTVEADGHQTAGAALWTSSPIPDAPARAPRSTSGIGTPANASRLTSATRLPAPTATTAGVVLRSMS